MLARDQRVVAGVRERVADVAQRLRVVVHHEDARGLIDRARRCRPARPAPSAAPVSSATGIVKANRVPWPSPPLSARMRPPWASTQTLADGESQPATEPARAVTATAVLLEQPRQLLRRNAPSRV